jgi:hypothetical protein
LSDIHCFIPLDMTMKDVHSLECSKRICLFSWACQEHARGLTHCQAKSVWVLAGAGPSMPGLDIL